MDTPKYQPLRIDRLEKVQQEKKYRGKSSECFLAAHNATTPFEKQAWLELGRDWDKLADEVRDLLDVPPTAQLDLTPQPEDIARVFQPGEQAGEV